MSSERGACTLGLSFSVQGQGRRGRVGFMYLKGLRRRSTLRRQVVLTAAAGSLLEWTQDLDP